MKSTEPKNLRYYAFLAPSLLFLAVFTYYPVGNALYLSLHKWNIMSPTKKFIGLQNYWNMVNDPLFWLVIKNNLIYALFTILPGMALALLFAILINERKRFKTFFQISLFYPMLIPMAAAAMLWVYLYNPHIGLINTVLGKLGLPQPGWVNSSETSLLAIIIMAMWKNIGYFMMIYLAGLQSVPDYLYEAALLDGAGWWKRHFYVTLPLTGPTSLFVFVIAIIQSFRVFDQVYLMTQGGPANSSNVLVYFIYENAFKYWDIGVASTLTSILVLILLVLVVIIFGLLGRRITYELS